MILEADTSLNILPGAEPFEFGSGSEAILFIHGWSSSPRELRFLAEELSHTYYCKGVRLNGHGMRSHRELIPYSWVDYYATVQNAYDTLYKTHQNITVIGLSFGGALGLHLAKNRDVKNLVLIAPFFRTPKLPIPFVSINSLVQLIPSFDISFPKKKVPGIDNPTARPEHIDYRKMHIKALKQLFKGVNVFRKNLQAVACPTLLLHSTKDRTSSFSNSVYILKRLGSKDKTLIALSNCNHIITLDYEKDLVEHKIIEWLKNHSNS